MTIAQILYLLDAVEGHSIHKTADKYHISPQGASKAIKSLEEELKVSLISRSTKGVYWTALGEKCAHHFQSILAHFDEIQSLCYETNEICPPEKISGMLHLAVTPRFSDSYLGKLLLRLHNTYPGIRLRVDAMTNKEIFECMQQEKPMYHFAIASILNMEPNIQGLMHYLEERDLEFVEVASKKLYLVASKKTLEQFPGLCRTEDAHGVPVVAYEYGGIMDAYRATYEYQLDSIASQREMINIHGMAGAYSLDEYFMHFTEKKHGWIPFDRDVILTYGYLMKKHELTEIEDIFLRVFTAFFVNETIHHL